MSGQRSTGGVLGAADGDGLQNLARVGLVSYGVIHLVLAWLALQLAWGSTSESPDQTGALATLAESPVGRPLLWVVAIGLVALAVWQALEVLRWRSGWSASGEARSKAVKRSVKALAKAAVYVALAVLAIRVATGSSGSSGSQQQQDTVAGVFGWPAGRWLVGAVGLLVLGVGVYHVYKGVTKHFLKEIDLAQAPASATRLVTRLGQVGYPGKGVALGVVGGLLVWSAVTFDPEKAGGLDGALRTILDAPFGRFLLTLVALGIAAFGAYLFVRARYPERT